MRVHVAYVAPDTELLIGIDLADGATVGDAIRASRVAERAGIAPDADACAIFGRRVTAETPLVEGDRVEITRPLACDPGTVRRRRAAGVGGDAVGKRAKRPRGSRS